MVAADESNGVLPVEGFTKLSHTADFSGYDLPNIPANRVLWWNADYVLYAARRALPQYDYYVMLEYDVFVNCDVDRLITQCRESSVDLVAQHVRRINPENHWCYASASEIGGDVWWALIPFVIASGRAIDGMLHLRQTMAVALAAGQITNWPYCEPFLPSAVAQQPGSTLWPLSQLVDSTMLEFRPFLSTRDPRLRKAELIAHPVMAGARFIKALITEAAQGSHYMTDGRLRPELQNEELNDLRAVLGEQIREQRNPDGTWSVTDSVLPRQPEIVRPWIDLSYGKPATQSSHSPWSRGDTAEADASLANRDPLPPDYAFHTGGDENPWWQVDLQAVCGVERIEIVNRAALSDRFSQFRIDASVDGTAWTTCFTKLDNAFVSNDPQQPARFTLPGQIHARFVRIVKLGAGVMHLRRVRVLGFPLPSPALAEIKPIDSGTKPRDAAPEPMDGEAFARLLATPGVRETLAETVETVVQQRVLGRTFDSYNIDQLAFLTAGIDSGIYAVAQMANARRFPNAASLHDYAVSCTPASGMVLEFGVFSGASINHIAHQMPGRRVYGFDSFEGLPEAWRPGFEQGAFRRADLPAVAGNVELVVGWFDNTLPGFVASNPYEKLALLHVDCDLYSSTKTVFSLLANRIIPGTIIIFDEYFNYPEWRAHEYKAFQELTAGHGFAYEYIGLVPSHQQVAVRITSVR